MSTVGEKLRNEREQQQLSLRDIEQSTSIRLRYLQAIEDGDYSILPGEVYAKGFIRNYANVLGFDGTDFVEMFKREITPTTTPSADTVKLAEERPLKQEHTSDILPKNITIKTTKKLRIIPAFFLTLLVLCAIGGIIYFIMGFMDKPPTDPPARPASPVTVTKPKVAEPSFQLDKTNDRITIIPNRGTIIDTISIDVTAEDKCWKQFLADEKEIYSGMLGKDQKITWKAKNIIWLKFGDAGAVNLTVNGQPSGKPGIIGQVVETTVTIRR